MSSALVLSSLVYLLSFLGLDSNIGEFLLSYLYTLPNSRTMELECLCITLLLWTPLEFCLCYLRSGQSRFTAIRQSMFWTRRCSWVSILSNQTVHKKKTEHICRSVQRRLAASEKNRRLNVEFLYTHPTGAKRVKVSILTSNPDQSLTCKLLSS